LCDEDRDGEREGSGRDMDGRMNGWCAERERVIENAILCACTQLFV